MTINTDQTPRPEDPCADFGSSTTPTNTVDPRLIVLNELITSGTKITYNGKHLKNDRVVGEFVSDHRPLRTAMLGSFVFLYTDPCTCCIPAYGDRSMEIGITDPNGAIDYVKGALDRNEVPDLLFVNERIYRGALTEIKELSPQTKLVVACDRAAPTSASDLRLQGIPAIDDQDYLNCAPLNAVIALTVFDELMGSQR